MESLSVAVADKIKESSLFDFFHDDVAVLNQVSVLILVVDKLGPFVNLDKLVVAPELVERTGLLSELVELVVVLSNLDSHWLSLSYNHLSEPVHDILHSHGIQHFGIARAFFREVAEVLVLFVEDASFPQVLNRVNRYLRQCLVQATS